MSRSKPDNNDGVAATPDALITDLDVRVSDEESSKIGGGFFRNVGGLKIETDVVSKPTIADKGAL
jgi:hypothetical protein